VTAPFDQLICPSQILHPVVLPLTIAVYNLLSLFGIVPKIEIDKKTIHHHLRSAGLSVDLI
jgi:hypothetical protein